MIFWAYLKGSHKPASKGFRMSESNEMYLLRTALLQHDDQPVPLSLLAQELAVSTASANEMCHKLMDEGLLVYEPYKGVTLTRQGAAMARRVLRRRRLWEVFLADQLGLDPAEAEAVACRFEHVTPDDIADRLATFLGNPRYSPQHEPIPFGDTVTLEPQGRPLTSLSTGAGGRVAALAVDAVTTQFLRAHGLTRGVPIAVLAVSADGPLLAEVAEQPLALARAIAEQIIVIPEPPAARQRPDPERSGA